jgi:hypothetical protein
MVPADELKELIVQSLEEQGFVIENGQISLPDDLHKAKVRELHVSAVHHKLHKSGQRLAGVENKLIKYISCGRDVVPEKISPRLVEVLPGSENELLFRYVGLHWSIPVSSGYGRRLRFIVFDEQNEKLIGILGLGDPVFSLRDRDRWVGWDMEARKKRLSYVMDAFVLGAVPPYSFLLCGKLVAMLAASNEVRNAFREKYGDRLSLIQKKSHDGRLALLTTTSALGRSSLYRRVKYKELVLYRSVGFTRGFGEFHFSNGLYKMISDYAIENCKPTAKHGQWGKGFRNRRETVRKCLVSLGLSDDWLYHGIQREIFVIPLASNAAEFLRGEHVELEAYNQSAAELFDWFRERWLLPRAEKNKKYLEFDPETYRLWGG